MTINDLIDELKAKKKIHSNEKVAKYLGISSAAIHKIVHGGGIADETAIKLANGIGREPLEVIAIASADKAKTPMAKNFWNKIIKISGTMTSLLILLPFSGFSSLHCILC